MKIPITEFGRFQVKLRGHCLGEEFNGWPGDHITLPDDAKLIKVRELTDAECSCGGCKANIRTNPEAHTNNRCSSFSAKKGLN